MYLWDRGHSRGSVLRSICGTVVPVEVQDSVCIDGTAVPVEIQVPVYVCGTVVPVELRRSATAVKFGLITEIEFDAQAMNAKCA